jgi:hypothetical protein
MNTPFDNCKFQICDLPGQCKGEGKCHHPAKHAKDEITLPITEYEAKMSAGDQMAELCLAIYEAKKVTPEQYELMQQLAYAWKY